MIAVDDELALWEELKEQVSDLLSTVDEKRSEAKETCDEKTPEFDELEIMLDDVKNYIEGRMFELWPGGYQFKRYVPKEWKPQARNAELITSDLVTCRLRERPSQWITLKLTAYQA